MAIFQRPESAILARDRLEQLTGLDLAGFFDRAFEENPAPDLALTNLERWLRATTSPRLYLQQLLQLPPAGRLLVTLMGGSQPVANALIQNPELASLLLEPSELRKPLRSDRVLSEGRSLLSAATSYQHALDRLRYLRQRWNLPIVMNDLGATWTQEAVWQALSDLASVLIQLAAEITWADYARHRQIDTKPDFMIVGFGKLGGGELNYSSDVDLVYVVEDGLNEGAERDCTRFFEAFGRALTVPMGRGTLYRVDLRLRPYGAAGPILRSMRAYEAYYKLYAEPWEVQALLRSKPILGSEELMGRWYAMRTLHCFRPKLSELSLEHMLAMKARVEAGASDADLKRGEGGIRDVEFLVQILQIIHGYHLPELQVTATCDALRVLESVGLLEHSVASVLLEGYTFLRRLEHRIQLVGDRQTHSIPADAEARESLAKLMGSRTWAQLSSSLERHRRTIQTLYRSTLKLEPATSGDRSQVLQKMGALGPGALQWFDLLPESAAFYESLIQNEGSLTRVRKILGDAPALISQFKASVPLTEMLISGEIEERHDGLNRMTRLSIDVDPGHLAETFLIARAALLARWTLSDDFDIGPELARLVDELIRHVARRQGIEFDVLGLGTYGEMDCGPDSDADLLFLVEDRDRQRVAESQAEQFLAFLGHLKRFGVRVNFDLRLRPEGSKGLLVRTLEGLRAYDLDGMEMWERFALGHVRSVHGQQASFDAVLRCAYGLPLTGDRLAELVKMKRRVETERVNPQHIHRQIKLGSGGLNDIEWLIHLHEMRHPEATKAGSTSQISNRIRNVAAGGFLNSIEREQVLTAHNFLIRLRAKVAIMGIEDDLLPENPDRLNRLATACGFGDGNALLSRHRSVTETVRRLYLEGLDRLKS